jgi:hypothetical protein
MNLGQALDFWTEFCCSHHSEVVFDIVKFLPSPLFEPAAPTATKRKASTIYRPIPEREVLDQKVIEWLKISSENDPLRGVRTMYDILSIPARRKLVSAASGSICSREAIISLLEETPEWGVEWSASLLEVIVNYDNGLASQRVAGSKRAKRLK